MCRFQETNFGGLLRAGGILWVEMLVEYFLANDSVLQKSARDVHELTNLVMLAWHRLIFGCDPTVDRIEIWNTTDCENKQPKSI